MTLIIPKEKCPQFYFRDDNTFLHRRLPLENHVVKEKKGMDVIATWECPAELLKDFEGYKGIRPGCVLVSYSRDIIYDPFNQLAGLTQEQAENKQPSITVIEQRSTEAIYRHEKAKPQNKTDKMFTILGLTMAILAFAVMLVAVT